jgi:hypothetical protein
VIVPQPREQAIPQQNHCTDEIPEKNRTGRAFSFRGGIIMVQSGIVESEHVELI